MNATVAPAIPAHVHLNEKELISFLCMGSERYLVSNRERVRAQEDSIYDKTFACAECRAFEAIITRRLYDGVYNTEGCGGGRPARFDTIDWNQEFSSDELVVSDRGFRREVLARRHSAALEARNWWYRSSYTIKKYLLFGFLWLMVGVAIGELFHPIDWLRQLHMWPY